MSELSEQSIKKRELTKEEVRDLVLSTINKKTLTQAALTKQIKAIYRVGSKRIRDAIEHLESDGLIKQQPCLLDMRTFDFVSIKIEDEVIEV